MPQLDLIPKSWTSWNFDVLAGGSVMAEIDVSWWRERGELRVDGCGYVVYREALMSGAFILQSDSTQLARAQKPTWMSRLFVIEHGQKTYTLKSASWLGRAFVLLENGQEVGSVVPQGMLTRKACVTLPNELPKPVQAFVIWLTVLLWKRDSDGAAAAAVAG